MTNNEMIDVGDRVEVHTLQFGSYPKKGVVLNMPRGAGDFFQIKLDSGETVAFNPYCSDFVCLIKED